MATAQDTINPGVTITEIASNDITQNRFVNAIGTHCGAAARASGISRIGVTAGSPFSIVVTGKYLIELGAAANADDEVESDADGKAIPLSAGKANGILMASGTTGDIVPILIK